MSEPTPAFPDLAVVIVTYNSAAVIADCLASIALDGTPDRVIVVDNASTDGTADLVAAQAPDAAVIRRNDNGGFAAGVNAGIEAAPGCDVVVLNADIRLRTGCLATLRLHRDEAGIVVPKLVDPDGSIHLSQRRTPKVWREVATAVIGGERAGRIGLGETVADPAAYERAHSVDWATGAAWLITAECIAAVGLLDDRYFLYSEETEYMLRARAAGFDCRYEPAALAVHLGGDVTTSARLWSLLVTNKVRLHRERKGSAAAVGMWLAQVLHETLRLVRGGTVGRSMHRAALRSLLTMRRWPRESTPDRPSYVCFAGQDWWYHNQAHSDFQLMRNVAAHRRVLVVNSIGMRMPMPGRSSQVMRRIGRKLRSVAKLVRRPLPDLPGFFVMSPLPLPFYGRLRSLNAALIRLQVRVACAVLGIRMPIVVVTIPTAWDVVRPMRKRALVVNRSDRYSEFPEADRTAIRALETALLTHADHAIYASQALLEDEREIAGDRAAFLDHGVDVQHFRTGQVIPDDLAAIPCPRVGFFGALDDYLVDFDLLEKVAAELPDTSLVLIGDASYDMDRFSGYPNVNWLGFRPYERIPAYGAGFDVALMPWLDNDWIRHANPIKLKEYLALGLPVVSTDFPGLARYRDVVRVAADSAEFVAQIRAALADDDPDARNERRLRVLALSWQAQAKRLMALAEDGTPCAE